MIGGGFTPASINLIQESLGCGGDILSYCIARANLKLSNKVLIIYADPLSEYLIKRLKTFDTPIPEKQQKQDAFVGPGREHGENLYILNLVKLTERDPSLMEDKHELQIKISSAVNDMLSNIQSSGDDFSEKFIFYLSLNPFLIKLGESTLDLIYNNLMSAKKENYVQIALLQKDLISHEVIARIQSLCHLISDLSSYDIGGLTDNRLKILKHAGTVHDIKAEPYILEHNREMDKYNFLIRGAFLTTFETMRNLLKYQHGTVYLANIPYLIAPVNYFNSLLDMPLNILIDAGKKEIREKSQGIGRKLTSGTETTYYLQDLELLKATLRSLSLFGFGNFKLDTYEEEENLMEIKSSFHKEFHAKSYKLFIKGLIEGIIRRSIGKNTRSFRIIKISDVNAGAYPNEHEYKLNIRLKEIEEV
jgi:archaellum biogenesis ATPase FlaH